MFGRMPKLPAEFRPKLEREERVLAWARTGDAAVVVTNRGLWLPGRSARLGWHEIHKVTWADETLTVTGSSVSDPPPVDPIAEPADTDDVTDTDAVGDAVDAGDYVIAADTDPVSLRLTEPGAVPRRVRDRVNASVAYSSSYAVPGGGAARVVGRRVSGRDGLNWSVRFDGLVHADDPAVRAAVDQFVAMSKASVAAA